MRYSARMADNYLEEQKMVTNSEGIAAFILTASILRVLQNKGLLDRQEVIDLVDQGALGLEEYQHRAGPAGQEVVKGARVLLEGIRDTWPV
jgi:hypothetical protein